LPGSGSEYRFYAGVPRAVSYAILVSIFAANVLLFVPLGQEIGSLFHALSPLRAYTWDLSGSLAGTLSFGAFSFAYFSPLLGMCGVMLVFLTICSSRQRLLSFPLFGLVLGGLVWANRQPAAWSPYYHITVSDDAGNFLVPQARAERLTSMPNPPVYTVSVNHDFYQYHATLNLTRYTEAEEGVRELVTALRAQRLLPYYLCAGRDRVAIMGSGGGMDVEAALLSGVRHVDAVEIDPMLVRFSRFLNPSAVYDDPRVVLHIDDARAFLRRATTGYDLVIFGYLDSQALFSSMSSIRLDGFTYTVESIRTAYALLNDDGMLSISFAAGKLWLMQKLIRMVTEGTGRTPICYVSGVHILLCVPKGKHTPPPDRYGAYSRRMPGWTDVDPPTDDWPYLYLAARAIPTDYVVVIVSLVVGSLLTLICIRGRGFASNDAHFLSLGFGFMLLQTTSIAHCSLYFGSTWFVTMLVVAGVLLMVLAANLVSLRMARFSFWLYLPLLAALLALYAVPSEWILSQTFLARILWTLLAVPLPIFFAGLIFSTTFRSATVPSALFGANLLGATLGGFSEYLSMAIGNHKLMVLVIVAYMASLCFRAMHQRRQGSA
jgi:hypothetical protein